jgi:hypothetical protein
LFIPSRSFSPLRRSGSGLPGLVTTELSLGFGLHGSLGALDGRNALNGGLAEVRTIALLGGLIGDGSVGLAARAAAAVLRLDESFPRFGGSRSLLADNSEALLLRNDANGLRADLAIIPKFARGVDQLETYIPCR